MRRESEPPQQSWTEIVRQQSLRRSLPVALPNLSVIHQTLRFDTWGTAARNMEYMKRILRKSPCFVWLSETPIPEHEFETAYEIGVEFFYASDCQKVLTFLQEQFLDDVIVIATQQKFEQANNMLQGHCLRVDLFSGLKKEEPFLKIQQKKDTATKKEMLTTVATEEISETLQQGKIALSPKSLEIYFLGQLYNDVADYDERMNQRSNPALKTMQSHRRSPMDYLDKLMSREISRMRGKTRFFALARNYYEDYAIEMENIEKFESEYSVSKTPHFCVLIEYTNISFFHKLLNAVLRGTEDPLALSYIELPLKDLLIALRELSQQTDKSWVGVTLYRRTSLSKKEISAFKDNKFILMNGFVSTSRSEDKALKFSGNTMFKIRPSQGSQKNGRLADISEYSRLEEEEVLIAPGCWYRVEGVREVQPSDYSQNPDVDYIVEITLLEQDSEQLVRESLRTDSNDMRAKLDASCANFEKFTILKNRITYKGESEWTQLLGSVPFSICDHFSLKVVAQSGHTIAMGAIDSAMRGEQWTYSDHPHIIFCESSGEVKGDGKWKIKEEGGQWQEGDTVSVKVDQIKGRIIWTLNGVAKVHHCMEKLRDRTIQWVPYIFMQFDGQCVEWCE